jgi:hypothetical protein
LARSRRIPNLSDPVSRPKTTTHNRYLTPEGPLSIPAPPALAYRIDNLCSFIQPNQRRREVNRFLTKSRVDFANGEKIGYSFAEFTTPE